MKIYKSKTKNIWYFIYRLISPVFDPITFVRGLTGYIWFVRDYFRFKRLSEGNLRFNLDLYPSLHDKSRLTPFDSHYFHQQIWAFENIIKDKPKSHVDVASTYQMSGYISKVIPTTFIDIRPIDAKLDNLRILDASILKLPFEDGSIESLSCLHVVEHIGLGRYGDRIDPDGMVRACAELSRVLSKGGKLYFSTPIGKKRICFNSHRVTPPSNVLDMFSNLKLLSFSVVKDNGEFVENTDWKEYEEQNYACGMFIFTKE